MGSPSGHGEEVLKKGPWTKEEDQKLLSYIKEHGLGSWRLLPQKAGLQRCGKSCRLRWSNYLRPDIKRGKFSSHEEKTIIRLHALLGNRWSAIAAHLPKRTDNEIKNYWNTRLKKRLTRMGIDPSTHKPKHNPPPPNLTHMAQWETARLEAEARLRHASKPLIINNGSTNNYNNNNCYIHNSAFLLVQPARPCLDVLKVWRATHYAANCSHDSGRSVNVVSDGIDCGFTEAAKGSIENSVHGHGYDRNNYGEVVGYNCNVDFDGCDDNNSMMMMSTDDHGVGHLEEGKSYWNELLNMVSSSNMHDVIV